MEELLKTFDLELTEFNYILIVIPVFCAFWFLMDKLIFSPFLKLVETREARTTGAESVATETLYEAERIQTDYEQQILNARIEAMKVRLAEVNKIKEEASQVLSTASTKAKQDLENARLEITSKQAALRDSLASNVDQLAKEIANKVKDGSSQISSIGN
ncbi:MAG: hypothetical protein R3A13_05375 [Bdellovibrionota bacterium]